MKRIILILLVILNLFILGLILLNKTDNTEHFASTSSASVPIQTCQTHTTPPENAILYDGKDTNSDFTITKTNVCNTPQPIFINNSDELVECTEGKDCEDIKDTKCHEYDNDKSYCLQKTSGEGDELNSLQKAYITIRPEEPTNNPFNKDGSGKFHFKFSFMLQSTGYANTEQKYYIVSSQSKLWNIYYQNKELFLAVNDVTNPTDFVESDKIKLNTDDLESYTAYPIIIYVTKYKVVINFMSTDKNNAKEIFLKNKDNQITDTQCKNAYYHLKNSDGTCLVTSDEYYLGALIHNNANDGSIDDIDADSSKNQYTDIFLYDYKIIEPTSETPDTTNPVSSCSNSFYGKNYKNKRKCLQDCNKIDVCSKEECKSPQQCDGVPICEFEARGRHSIDCIQQCIQNVDCTAEFCKDKCEGDCKLDDGCPWNQKQDTEMYDSQYFDKAGKPSPVLITLSTVSTDGSKAIVKWRPPYAGKLPVKGYISYLYKTFNKAEAVRINKINISNCLEYCEYIIKELEPNETYTFGVKAYSDVGLGEISNLLTFKASIINVNLDFTMDDDIDDSAIGDFYAKCPNDDLDPVGKTTKA